MGSFGATVMPTVSRDLPGHTNPDVCRQQALDLLQQCKAGSKEAIERIRRRLPSFMRLDDNIIAANIQVNDAQLVIAREYGLESWAQLELRIESYDIAKQIDQAIRSGDADTLKLLFSARPELLDVPVRSGNWGPPMSHAANMGRLEMVKAIAALGAKDFQHAFDRALLHGDIEIAGWLRGKGAAFTPGVIMGACETLNERGFSFLDDAGVSITDGNGNRLAPLAMVLETYCRHPEGKHEILRRLASRGYSLPDTPMMAFHCGDLDRLKELARLDPGLIHRRFTYQEIYPTELGCADDHVSGLHGTPISDTTLLHCAIDYDEIEIFDWLLTQGADVNAAATIDAEGFGRHTPLFNAMVSQSYATGRQRDAYMTKRLLELGADTGVRVSLRKFLDWRENPEWHIARNVTPLQWAADFPERGWVNCEAVSLLE